MYTRVTSIRSGMTAELQFRMPVIEKPQGPLVSFPTLWKGSSLTLAAGGEGPVIRLAVFEVRGKRSLRIILNPADHLEDTRHALSNFTR